MMVGFGDDVTGGMVLMLVVGVRGEGCVRANNHGDTGDGTIEPGAEGEVLSYPGEIPF